MSIYVVFIERPPCIGIDIDMGVIRYAVSDPTLVRGCSIQIDEAIEDVFSRRDHRLNHATRAVNHAMGFLTSGRNCVIARSSSPPYAICRT